MWTYLTDTCTSPTLIDSPFAHLVYDGGDSGAIPSELHGLCLTAVEGPNNSVLTNNVHDHYPVWSPDGTRSAFMH